MNKFIDFEEENEEVQSEILVEDDFMPKLSDEYRKKLIAQRNKWLKSQSSLSPTISDEEMRDTLIKDLSFLCNMSTEEYTLYRKYVEIHRDYPSKQNSWFEDTSDYHELELLKSNLWIPSSIDDYKRLKPRVICTEKERPINSPILEAIKKKYPNTVAEWNALRVFIHTQINNSNIGRNLYFIIDDEITGKYLGILALSSDFLDLTPRDEYIGWSRELKTQGRMINHTGIGSTIAPTQPLGFNYVGGKLMALLMASDKVEEAWNETYNSNPNMPSKLVGITTTSLYSSLSQYTNLKYWNHLGHTAGSIKFEPSERTIDLVKEWLSRNKDEELRIKFWEWYIATEPQGMPLKRDYKQRSLGYVYGKLEIEKKYFETNHSRGIYFCPLFTNTKEYLRQEVSEDKLVRRFDNSVEALVELWKSKYAVKRIQKLVEDNRTNLTETLFYDDIINMSWEQVKEKYLSQVGR